MSALTLTQLETARLALMEVKTIDEAKDIRDKAEAVLHYTRQQKGSEEIALYAAEIKVRAERRLGELLAEMPKSKGGNPNRCHDVMGSPKTYRELGVSAKDAERWQKVGSIPEFEFEAKLTEQKETRKEITSAEFYRLAKSLAKDDKAAARSAPTGPVVTNSLDKLVAAGTTFGCVYADPPWQYGNQATRAATDNHYKTMTVQDICALPVAKLTAPVAHCHLWTTNAFTRDAFDVLDAWGFEYKSMFVWVKPQMGIGNYWRVSHELLLLGVKGGLTFADHGLTSWAELPRTKHSAKPPEVRRLVERASPGEYLELFGKTAVDGWTVLGNQIEVTLYDSDVQNL